MLLQKCHKRIKKSRFYTNPQFNISAQNSFLYIEIALQSFERTKLVIIADVAIHLHWNIKVSDWFVQVQPVARDSRLDTRAVTSCNQHKRLQCAVKCRTRSILTRHYTSECFSKRQLLLVRKSGLYNIQEKMRITQKWQMTEIDLILNLPNDQI